MNSPGILFRRLKTVIFDRFPPGVWLMTFIDTLIQIGFSISWPFLALYLHDERHLSMSVVGVMFLIGGLFAAGTNLVGGMFSDRIGRKRLLMMISGMGIVAYSCLALLVGFSAPVWLIVIVYIASRGIIGTIQPTISAIVADLSPSDRLTESYALIRVGGNIGFAVGPAIGGYLRMFLSFGWLLGIASVTCAIVIVLVLFFLKDTFTGNLERVDIRSTLRVARDYRFLLFSLFCLLLFASMAQLGSTLSVFTVDRIGFTTAQYGLLLSTNGVIVFLFQYPIAFLMNKFPRDRGLILGSLLYTIGYTSLGWVTSFNWAMASIFIITAGEITFSPIASSVVAESAPASWRGRYMGFFSLSQTLGASFAPLFGGILLDVFPYEPKILWGIIGIVGILPAIGFSWWGRRQFKKQTL